MVVKVDPSIYRKYATIFPREEPLLYIKFNKGLYGLLGAVFPLYQKLVG